MAELTEEQLSALRDPRVFGAVATLKKDGFPHTSMVWLDTDGENVLFNTTKSRAKTRHIERDPRVSVMVFHQEDPYSYFEVEGTATLDDEGANEHITKLSQKYTGKDFHTPENRVIVRVRPERIFAYVSPA
jgi:PPOX class probable F420-dependent enzyme